VNGQRAQARGVKPRRNEEALLVLDHMGWIARERWIEHSPLPAPKETHSSWLANVTELPEPSYRFELAQPPF
jgi:hypothetical protein